METYHGHVRSPQDAIILFEACRMGVLPRVQRRLSEKERQQIKSGSVFVWDEREAGMRRWTDGKSWSASRVSGSFLTYREMEGKRGGNGIAQPAQPAKKSTPKSEAGSKNGESDEDGPDGYRYKPDGLMKQSFSITTSTGQHLHLISYYARSSANASPLQQPTQDPALRHIRPQKGMYPDSSVTENQNVPAVTRGPMAGSVSPYAPALQQMGSPYGHPGASPHGYGPPPGQSWPPTPLGTPPAYYGQPVYYVQQGRQFVQYPHHGYPPTMYPPAPPTVFDRAPPPLAHPNFPPPPAHLTHHLPAQQSLYTHNPPSHAEHAAQIARQAAAYQQSINPGPNTSAPGPQLPPPNGVTAAAAQKENINPLAASQLASASESLPLPDRTAPLNTTIAGLSPTTAANPSPTAKVVPRIDALINSAPDSAPESAQSDSRAGSRSPGSMAQRGAKDIPGDRMGFAGKDQSMLRRLDKSFAV
ncbi:Gluconate transport-inducing protein [Coniosporium tulheliwenetii]|uniref:Gluconate transport-inducing protein n=1 Tax=Coniosporium tulheliwenetii TaxID=3383036 RepID=A0ACC2ZM64_9PEZI|nr:Gluconate transport-inducing protein [Cladosporium sp. JES 115]